MYEPQREVTEVRKRPSDLTLEAAGCNRLAVTLDGGACHAERTRRPRGFLPPPVVTPLSLTCIPLGEPLGSQFFHIMEFLELPGLIRHQKHRHRANVGLGVRGVTAAMWSHGRIGCLRGRACS